MNSVPSSDSRITLKLTQSALLLALALILSVLPVYTFPQGGSVTLCSMAPILFIAHKNGIKWGLIASFAFSLFQLITGIDNVSYCPTLITAAACILLDYILPFTFMGLSPVLEKPFGERISGAVFSAVTLCALRFLCSFLSGVLIWREYAPEGTPVWLYSLTYNGAYMLPETVLTAIGYILFIRIYRKQSVA